MPLRPDMELQDYIRIFFRRKWVIIFSFLSVFFGAGVYALTTPAMYKSTTTILIIPQPVPENYVRSTVTLNMEDRLPTIQQQITSRTRLIKVMEELGLFREERKEQVLDDIVDMMKQQVEIDVAQDRRKAIVRDADVFSISFSYQDPKLAMLTASRLASTFIDENLKSRERQAVGTSKLLGSQLKETKAKLEAQEEKVREYKVRYLGELPQELQPNLSSLSRLEQQYNSNVNEIRDAESRKLQLQSQLSVISRGPQTIVHGDGKTEIDTSQDVAQALITQLTLRRNLLAEASAKYTERHPDVVRLRHEVEELEKKLRGAPTSVHSGDGTGKNVTSSPVYLPLTEKERAEFRRLKQQIVSIEGEIAALRAEKTNIQRRIMAAQAKVDRAPRREQDLISLTRDYENLKRSYDELVKKKLDADMSHELEMRQQGDQFQVLDPANLPAKPFKPKLVVVFACALLMGGVLGFGGAIGMEIMDPSLRGVTDFKYFFDVPILACIPILDNKETGRRHNLRKTAVLAGIVSLAFFIFAFLVVYGQEIRKIFNY